MRRLIACVGWLFVLAACGNSPEAIQTAAAQTQAGVTAAAVAQAQTATAAAPTATASPSATPSATASPLPTSTPTASPTASASPSATFTPEPSITPTTTAAPTATPSLPPPLPSPTATPDLVGTIRQVQGYLDDLWDQGVDALRLYDKGGTFDCPRFLGNYDAIVARRNLTVPAEQAAAYALYLEGLNRFFAGNDAVHTACGTAHTETRLVTKQNMPSLAFSTATGGVSEARHYLAQALTALGVTP